MSEMKTLLLELHCEEIPARFLKPLTQDFAAAFTKWAEGEKLGYEAITPYYSPRKLSWTISDLPVAQADQAEIQVGPPQRMCVDEAGQPTVQGQKFAEKWGVGFEAVRFEQPTGKKEPCAVVELTRQGRPTLELLVEALPRLIAGLHVPKAMRWGHSSFEFVRPVRNVLCLFGKDIVPIEIDGVKATASTWGHRLHHLEHPKPIKVERPREYVEALKAAGVVVSFAERRAILEAQLDELATQTGGQVVKDEELLDTLAEIVEWPRALRGEFPPEFMELPKEVLVTSLKEHQKSFCIEKTDGTDLLPFFLTVANRDDDPAGFIKAGNEWVLKARLYDARFFFAEDRRTPLQDRLEKLKQLTFHRELGSYLEKTERIQAIATGLAHAIHLDLSQADHAARLSKADLMTLMVGEFPELQGVMGGEYLRHEGEPEAVWKAVKEQYRPVSAEDAIPGTPLGGLLAVADKLDTVAGCFAIGQIPSGSKDPLALRRSGIGITRILWEQGWDLSMEALVDLGLKAVGSRASKPLPETREALLGFFKDRVAYQLEVAGYAGAVRRSALATGWSDLLDLKARCEALSAFAEDERFASLAQSVKRIGNILKDEAPAESFDANLLQALEEIALSERLVILETAADQRTLLAALAELAQPLAAFFDAVMVKCEDEALRGARLSLLSRLRSAFLKVADFSLWQ